METKEFNELVESVKQMKQIRAGKAAASRVWSIDEKTGKRTQLSAKQAKEIQSTSQGSKTLVREIRVATRLSQAQFANLIQVKVSTLKNWEQGRRQPTGPAKALLTALQADPKSVLMALNSVTQPARRVKTKQQSAA